MARRLISETPQTQGFGGVPQTQVSQPVAGTQTQVAPIEETQSQNTLWDKLVNAGLLGPMGTQVGRVLFPAASDLLHKPLEYGLKASPFSYVGKTPTEATKGFAQNVLKPAAGVAGEIGSWMVPLAPEVKAVPGLATLAEKSPLVSKVAPLALRGASGYAQAALQAIGRPESTAGSVQGAGTFGAALNVLAPGVEKILGKGAGLLGKVAESTAEKVPKEIATKYMGLKASTIPWLRKLADADPFKTLDNVQGLMDETHNMLNDFLYDKRASWGEFKAELMKTARMQLPALKREISLAEYTKNLDFWLDDFARQEYAKMGMKPIAINNKAQVPLILLNEIKKKIGGVFMPEEQSILNGYYVAAKDFVAKNSGDPEFVNTLNKEYAMLRDAKQNVMKVTEGTTTPRLGKEAAAIGGSDILTALLGYGVTGGIPGAGLIVGGKRALESTMRDPETAQKVSQLLSKTPQLEQKLGQVGPAIFNALTRLGIRIPGLLY